MVKSCVLIKDGKCSSFAAPNYRVCFIYFTVGSFCIAVSPVTRGNLMTTNL